MATGARQLSDVVDVVDDGLQRRLGLLIPGPQVSAPARIEHPGIEGRSNDAVSFGDGLDHVVRQLALTGCQSPAVVVAGTDGTVVTREQFPVCFVGQMGDIDHDPGSLQGFEQGFGGRQESSLRRGSMRIGACSVV